MNILIGFQYYCQKPVFLPMTKVYRPRTSSEALPEYRHFFRQILLRFKAKYQNRARFAGKRKNFSAKLAKIIDYFREFCYNL